MHSDLQTSQAMKLLSSLPQNNFSAEALRIGPAGDFPNFPTAALALRRRRRDADLVHVWGPVELAAAALADFDRIIFSPPPFIPRRWQKWIRLIRQRRAINIVISNPRCNVLLNGDPLLTRPTIIPPGVPIESAPSKRNNPLRAALGIAPEDFVTIAPGESTRAANHKDALWTVGILYCLSDQYRIVLWGLGEMNQPIGRLSRKMGQRQMLVRAQQLLNAPIDFQTLLSVADAAAFTGQCGAPMLPALMCMAAGLPIVAYRTPIWTGILEPNMNALIDEVCTPRTLGQCLMDLRGDPALRQTLGAAAQKTAIEQFSIEQFVRNWTAEYERVSNAKFSRPERILTKERSCTP